MSTELLDGRICLVTGSSRGIGLGVAKALAAHGGTVILHGRDEKALRSAVASLKGPRAHHIVPANLSSQEGIERLLVEIAKCFGKLHVLIHSAGILGLKVPLAEYPAEVWDEVIRLNLKVPFLLTKALLPLLRKGDRPSVVFVSSGAGRRGHGGWGAYSVSKFGVEGLTQVWADELGREGIRVNAVNPGGTRTRMRALAYPEEDPETLPTPDDIAPVFVWLARADTQVTGQSLDGRDWLGRQPVP